MGAAALDFEAVDPVEEPLCGTYASGYYRNAAGRCGLGYDEAERFALHRREEQGVIFAEPMRHLGLGQQAAVADVVPEAERCHLLRELSGFPGSVYVKLELRLS